jgi:hypothetical protein
MKNYFLTVQLYKKLMYYLKPFNMKSAFIKNLLVLTLLFIAGTTIAQPPPSIPFQAIAKDPLGNPAKNRKIFVKDIIYQTSAVGGTRVWEEAHETTSNEDGIYTIYIGKGTLAQNIPIKGIDQIDWAHGPFFINLKVAIAPPIPTSWWLPADNYIDYGTTQLLSVPFALFAGNASVTNVNTSIQPGPFNTFLITDSLGHVNWQTPQAAQQTVTTITNFNLSSVSGANAIIFPNTTSVVEVTVKGVRKGDSIVVTAQEDYQDWTVYSAWVYADDTVRIRFANFTNQVVNVLGSQYKIVVIKY